MRRARRRPAPGRHPTSMESGSRPAHMKARWMSWRVSRRRGCAHLPHFVDQPGGLHDEGDERSEGFLVALIDLRSAASILSRWGRERGRGSTRSRRVLQGWVAVGFVLAYVLVRRGHDSRTMTALGIGLGPLSSPSSSRETSDGRCSSRLGPVSPRLVVLAGRSAVAPAHFARDEGIGLLLDAGASPVRGRRLRSVRRWADAINPRWHRHGRVLCQR